MRLINGEDQSTVWLFPASTLEFNPRHRESFPSFQPLKPKPGISAQHMTQAFTKLLFCMFNTIWHVKAFFITNPFLKRKVKQW